jgi:hypothetical protein
MPIFVALRLSFRRDRAIFEDMGESRGLCFAVGKANNERAMQLR